MRKCRQVSFKLQVSSQYSGLSQQCCCLDCLDSFPDFQVFHPRSQAFGDCSKYDNYSWYHIISICLSSGFLLFSLCGALRRWSPLCVQCSFFVGRKLLQSLVILPGFSDVFFISKFNRILWVSFSWKDSGLWVYHLFVWSNFNFLHIQWGSRFPSSHV